MKPPKAAVDGKACPANVKSLNDGTGPYSAAPTVPPAALAAEHRRLGGGGAAGLHSDRNQEWQRQRRHVTLAGNRGTVAGLFKGIDSRGRPLLGISAGSPIAWPAHRVKSLREIP